MNRFPSRMIALLLAVTLVITVLPVTTIYAADADAPLFSVGSKTNLTLEQALAFAGSSGTIIMTKSGTLSGGEYTIPSGVVLLLPYEPGANTVNDSSNSLPYANSTADSSTNKICLPDEKLYMNLSLSDVQLNVQGKLVVGGRYSSAGGLSGQTSGSHSNIRLDQDSTIVVEKEGILSCNGYILGEGTVTLENGGSMYEPFLIVDYGGGTYTVGAYHGGVFDGNEENLANTGNSIMPFNIFSMQNIQCLSIIRSGAEVYGYCDMYTDKISLGSWEILSARHNVTTVKIIGESGALINLTSGELKVKYDPEVYAAPNSYIGRTTIVADGKVNIGSLILPVSILFYDIKVNSNVLNFPIPYNICYVQNSETLTIPEGVSIKVLPGAEIYIEENAKLEIGSSDNDLPGQLFLYDGFNGRSYPNSSQLLQSASFSQRAKLVLNGEMDIDGSFAGTVETEGTGTIDTSSNAKLSASVYDGVESGWGVSVMGVNRTIGSTTRVRYDLTAQIVDHSMKYSDSTSCYIPIEQGQTYYGLTREILHTVTSYQHIVNPVASSAVTNVNYASVVPIMGSWSEHRVLFDDGETVVTEIDPEVVCEPGKLVKKYTDSQLTEEITENPEQGVVYYQIIDCDHRDSAHTSYNATDNGHTFMCTVCGDISEEADHVFGETFISTKDGHIYACICDATKIDPHTWGENGNCSAAGCGWNALQIDADEDEVVLSHMDLSGQIVIAACYEVSGERQGRMVSCDVVSEKSIDHDYYVFKLNGLEKDMKVSLFFLDENYCPAEQDQIKQIAS